MITVKCQYCKKDFEVHNYRIKTAKFCSKKCYFSSDRKYELAYSSLHQWIRKFLGKPTTCQHCGKSGLVGRKIHWANIDHKYRKNKKDWLRLCMKCHIKYDISKNQWSGGRPRTAQMVEENQSAED